MRNKTMRPAYISGAAVTVLLLIATTAIVYTTVKVKSWWDGV